MRAFREVEPINRRLGVALATLSLCSLLACTNVTGGAVELSWHLQTFDGGPATCNTIDTIETIRLWWQVDQVRGSHDFKCVANHGVTSFDVPVGSALLWVEPACLDGTPVKASSFIAPAPIERTISVGDVVELHAVVIELAAGGTCK